MVVPDALARKDLKPAEEVGRLLRVYQVAQVLDERRRKRRGSGGGEGCLPDGTFKATSIMNLAWKHVVDHVIRLPYVRIIGNVTCFCPKK